MNIQDKTKEELMNELQELQQAHNALKASSEAGSIAQKQTMEALQASEERFRLLFNKAPLGYQSLDFDGNFIEIKHAEKALIESEEKYRLLHENAGIGIGYYKVDGTIISYNTIAARNMNGVPEDFNGKSIYDFFPKSVAEFYHERIKKAAVSEFPVTYEDEVNLPTRNNYFLSTYARISNTGGEIEGIQILSQDITDRRQAEEALKESEENLSTTLQSIGDAVISTDNNGFVLSMNPVAETLCGWQLTDALGKPLAEVFTIINAETRQTVADPVKKVFEKGEIVGLANHTILVSQNGTEYQISDSAAPIKNKEGAITGVVLVFSDITGSYMAQKQIKDSVERYDLAMKASNDGLFDWNLETNEIYYSPAWKKMLGYEDDELPNDFSVWENTTEPEHVKKSWEMQQQLISKQIDRFVLEFKMKHKEGHWVDILSRAEAIFNDSGKAVRIVGTHTDITERKRAEEKEKELLKRFELISLHLPGVIYQFRLRNDGSFHFPYASPGISKIYGVLPKDVEHDASSAFKAIYPEDLEQVSASIYHSAETLTPWHDIYRVNQPSGKTIWVEGNSTPQKLDDGSIIWHGFIHDITERKLAEEELKSVKASLELCLEASQIGIWSHDLIEDPEHIKEVSFRDLKHDQIFGYKEKIASWGQEKMLEQVIDEDREATRKAFDNVFEKGRLDFECRILWPDNTIHWIACGGKVYKDSAGQPNQINGTVMDITGRKLAEQELIIAKEHAEESEKKLLKTNEEYRRSNQLLEESQSISKVGGWEFDMVNNKLYWTAETYRIHDTSPEEFNPTVDAGVSYFLPESKKLISDALELAMTNGTGYDLILETYTTKGRKIDVRTTCQVTLEDGKPVKLTGIFQDITVRRQLEDVHAFLSTSGYPGSDENFFESLAKYLAQILDSEYVCIDKLEGDGLAAQTVAVYNEGKFDPNVSYALKQTPCGDVVGKAICCFPENVCQLFPHDEALQDLKAHSYIGTTLWSFDGKPIGLIAIIGQKPLKNAAFAENVLKLVAIRAAGELERMQAEEKLRESEAIKNTMVSNIGDVIVIIDQNEINQYKSPNITTLFGWQPEELVGKSTWDNVHADDLDAAREFLATLATEPYAKGTTEIRYKRKDGKYVWIEITVANLLSDPDINGLLGNYHDITERKLAEEDLKLSEKRYQFSLASTGQIGWSTPPDGVVEDMPMWREYSGQSLEEVVGWKWLDAVHPDDRESAYKAWSTAAAQKINYITEYRIRRADGVYRNFMVRGIPLLNADGSCKEWVGTCIDITERMNAENALRKSEAIKNTMVSNIGDVIVIIDQNEINQYKSPNITPLFGWQPEELVGKSTWDTVHPDDLDAAMKFLATLAKEPNAKGTTEIRYKRKDGEYVWIEFSVINLLHDKDIQGLLGNYHDISERKQAEIQLRVAKEKAEENEAYLISVLQSNNDIIVSRDLDNNVVFFNKAFDDITMELFNQHAYAGMNTLNLLPAEGRIFWENILQKVKNGDNHEEEYNYKTLLKSADYITLHVPVFHGSKVVGTLEVTKDITAFKNREDELKQAKDQAEESDRLKSTFLANMSHEIRTPLNSIIGFSELLTDPDYDDEQKETFAGSIINNGNHLLEVISDIIDISKIESGQVILSKKKFNAQELISEIYDEYKIKALLKNIDLRIDPSTSEIDCLIESDRSKLKQVLINFVGNALKFTTEGSIEIGMKVTQSTVKFSVKDTGIGIHESLHGEVFERFRQLEDSSTRKYGGNGLGLAISKSLIELLGGTIGLDSQPGKGSTFYFTLPGA